MWRRDIDGKVLTFHLAGINNQNFLMRDEETGSVWQQISGKAIFGPMKGQTLTRYQSDELSFAEWKAEEPAGVVLAPISAYVKAYDKQRGWEKEVAKYDTPNGDAHIAVDREVMLGLEAGGVARAFPLKSVLDQKLVEDQVGSTLVLLLVGQDNLSVRAFKNRIPSTGQLSDFYRAAGKPGESEHPDASGIIMTDSATQSGWNFQGCAVSGPLQGQCLRPLEIIKDYWFDWKAYHPQTSVYRH